MNRLSELAANLTNENKTDISFVIVNPSDHDDVYRLEQFKSSTSLPILQDISKINVWNLYKGITDDMLIFDKLFIIY